MIIQGQFHPSFPYNITSYNVGPSKYCNHHKLHTCTIHYANKSVQYTAIFHGCKNDNFQMKNCDVFLKFSQNIDWGAR